MDSLHLKHIRIVGLFGLGCLLFSYPCLSLFNAPRLVGGIPLLYGYLFTVWAGLILLAGIIIRLSRSDQASNPRNRD